MFELFFTKSDFLIIFLFIALIIFSVLISDFLEKKINNIHEEILRKIPHITIGLIFISTPFFLSQSEIIILSIILFFGIFIGKYSPFFKSVFSIKRVSFGMWVTPLALGIMAFLWIPENINAFIFGMLIFTFSDSMAALFGRLYGKKKIPYSNKTYLGSFTFFLTSFIIILFMSENINIPLFLLVAIYLTFLEIILAFGLDNLFLPIVASYLFYFLLF